MGVIKFLWFLYMSIIFLIVSLIGFYYMGIELIINVYKFFRIVILILYFINKLLV